MQQDISSYFIAFVFTVVEFVFQIEQWAPKINRT